MGFFFSNNLCQNYFVIFVDININIYWFDLNINLLLFISYIKIIRDI
jgi:hypothetical protein